MQYITEKKKEMNTLLRMFESGDAVVKHNDGIEYTKNEIQMMMNRVQRQIDGYKRFHANMSNKSMTIKDFALFKALAIKEHEYYLEVENRIDTFTSTKLMSAMNPENYEKTFYLIRNLNAKIALRSKVSSKSKWIEDRTFELASVGEIQNFELVNESFYNINCLDSIMSGKMSKAELEKAGLWRVIHENHTNSIYIEVGNLLRHGENKIHIP